MLHLPKNAGGDDVKLSSSAADLPHLDGGDLKSFGMGKFGDRKDLKTQLQKLKQAKEGSKTEHI